MPVMVSAGQVLMKKGVRHIVIGEGIVVMIRSCFRITIIASVICIASAPLLYIRALEVVPLSEAFAFNSLNFIFVFLAGRFILGERQNARRVIGVILISAGFLLPFLAEVVFA